MCGRISKARRDTRASGAELERIPNMHRKMLGLPGLVVNEDGIVEIHRDASEKPENISDNLMGLLAFLGLAAFVTNQVLKEINARKLQDTYIDPQRAFHEAEAKGTGMDASCKVTLRDIHNLKVRTVIFLFSTCFKLFIMFVMWRV